MNIENLKQFMHARGFGEQKLSDVKRNTYKFTDCGAWVAEETESRVDYESPHIEEFCDAPTYDHPVGITVGSIVEGVDFDCQPVTVKYPFALDDFWKALKTVEDEATEIWNDTHGCDDCGMDHPEYGTQMINPKCSTCNGEGAII